MNKYHFFKYLAFGEGEVSFYCENEIAHDLLPGPHPKLNPYSCEDFDTRDYRNYEGKHNPRSTEYIHKQGRRSDSATLRSLYTCSCRECAPLFKKLQKHEDETCMNMFIFAGLCFYFIAKSGGPSVNAIVLLVLSIIFIFLILLEIFIAFLQAYLFVILIV